MKNFSFSIPYFQGKRSGKAVSGRLIVTISVLLMFIISCSSAECRGQAPKITEMIVTSNADNMVVYARVTDLFTEDMEKAIWTGVSIILTYTIDLYRERRYWFDKKISRLVMKHNLKYDTAKKIFHVSAHSSKKESEGFTDYLSAKSIMSEINGVSVAALRDLNKDKKYYVRMKAKLERVRHPRIADYLSFFISWSESETDWYSQKAVF